MYTMIIKNGKLNSLDMGGNSMSKHTGHILHNIGRNISGQETPEERRLRREQEQREQEYKAQQARTDLKNKAAAQRYSHTATQGATKEAADTSVETANAQKRANLAKAMAEQNKVFKKKKTNQSYGALGRSMPTYGSKY